MERTAIRKSFLGIVGYVILEALFLNGVSFIDLANIEFIDLVNTLGAIVFLVLTVKVILYPYIIIEKESIYIFRDYFLKDRMVVRDIVSVDIAASPLSKSSVVLKNGARIKFDSFSLRFQK